MHAVTSITTQQGTAIALACFIVLTVYAFLVARSALNLYRQTEALLTISEKRAELLNEDHREEVHRRMSADNLLRERATTLEVERRRFDHLLGIGRADLNARQLARNGNPYSAPT